MALEIIRETEVKMSGGCKSDRRLYLTQDKSHVVEEGDPHSAWLLFSKGQDVLQAELDAHGLTARDGKIVLPGSEPEPTKAREKTQDKSLAKEDDKARKKAAKK